MTKRVIIQQKAFEIDVDNCIANEIIKLNELGVRTVNSCCGHGENAPSAIIENNHGSLLVAEKMGYSTGLLHGNDLLFSKILLKSKCECRSEESE